MQARPILVAVIALIIAALACGESTPEPTVTPPEDQGEEVATSEPETEVDATEPPHGATNANRYTSPYKSACGHSSLVRRSGGDHNS
jgi:hypothetical protein